MVTLFRGFALASVVVLAFACSGDDDDTSDDGDRGGTSGSGGAGASGGAQSFGGSGARGGSSGSGTGGTGGENGGTGGATGGGGSGKGGSATGQGGANGGSGGGDAGKGGAGTGGSAGTSEAGSAGMPEPGDAPTIGGCPIFPPSDAWNQDISAAPASQEWTERLQRLVGDVDIHPDYGNGDGVLYGIPVNVVPEDQALVEIAFDWYDDESDPGPYPFPDPGDVKIEGGSATDCDGDCHVLVVQQGSCQLFEGFACYYEDGWHCGNGARWDLTRDSYGQRPKGWTSADAAGLAITPGLVRYDEVRAGELHHAIRFTVPCTRPNFVAPATHQAVPGGCSNPDAPPMGLRVRLRADYDISSASESAQVVLRAMKRYGMILADNGSSFYFQGEAHPGWMEDDIEPLKDVPASAFEALEPPPLED